MSVRFDSDVTREVPTRGGFPSLKEKKSTIEEVTRREDSESSSMRSPFTLDAGTITEIDDPNGVSSPNSRLFPVVLTVLFNREMSTAVRTTILDITFVNVAPTPLRRWDPKEVAESFWCLPELVLCMILKDLTLRKLISLLD